MKRTAKSDEQDIVNWNTAALTNMYSMFNGATVFNQNLSGWCVTNIGSLPGNFDAASGLASSNRPVWGTCP